MEGWLKFFNQTLIDPDHFFNKDRDRDEFFLIKVCLKNFNQSLLKIFQSRSGCKKLNRSATTGNDRLRRKPCHRSRFSIKVCLKNFNQGLMKKFQSKSAENFSIKV